MLVFGSSSFGQKLSLVPQVSLGMYIPGAQQSVLGNEWLTYDFRFYTIGDVINTKGISSYEVKATNKIGLKAEYALSSSLFLLTGAHRTNLHNAYITSFVFEFYDSNVTSIIENGSFYDIDFGLKYKAKNYFGLFQMLYILNPPTQVMPIQINYLNSVKTGIRIIESEFNTQKFNFYLGIGKELSLLNRPCRGTLGLNFSLKPQYVSEINFIEKNKVFATNTMKKTANAIFIGLEYPIQISLNKKMKPSKKVESKQEASVIIAGKKMVNGSSIILDNVQFEQSKYDLNILSTAALDKIYELMDENRTIKVEISGHSSSEGNRDENIMLSKNRAKACKEYLVKKGINKKRIKIFGIGPDRPISDSNQSLNRRVELKVIIPE